MMPRKKGKLPDFAGQAVLAWKRRMGLGWKPGPMETVEEYLARGGKIKRCPPRSADKDEIKA